MGYGLIAEHTYVTDRLLVKVAEEEREGSDPTAGMSGWGRGGMYGWCTGWADAD